MEFVVFCYCLTQLCLWAAQYDLGTPLTKQGEVLLLCISKTFLDVEFSTTSSGLYHDCLLPHSVSAVAYALWDCKKFYSSLDTHHFLIVFSWSVDLFMVGCLLPASCNCGCGVFTLTCEVLWHRKGKVNYSLCPSSFDDELSTLNFGVHPDTRLGLQPLWGMLSFDYFSLCLNLRISADLNIF